MENKGERRRKNMWLGEDRGGRVERRRRKAETKGRREISMRSGKKRRMNILTSFRRRIRGNGLTESDVLMNGSCRQYKQGDPSPEANDAFPMFQSAPLFKNISQSP